jgi:CO/xanthine dehydrogenase FAD-binding subunit
MMEYRVAASVEEALGMLAAGADARPIAGGTDLSVIIADGVIAPGALIDISSIPALKGVRAPDGGLAIGAATRVADIAARADLPACLKQGASAIGSPQIRNLATIGGNICNASPCGDTLAPLICLDARFVLLSRTGRREVPAETFFLGPKKTVLRPDELLVEILIDPAHLQGSSAFRMIGKRKGQAISQVNAALWLVIEGGEIRDARAAVGSVAPTPLRLRSAEEHLRGKKKSKVQVNEVLDAVDREITPISDVRASLEYRRVVTAGLFRDLLAEVLGG